MRDNGITSCLKTGGGNRPQKSSKTRPYSMSMEQYIEIPKYSIINRTGFLLVFGSSLVAKCYYWRSGIYRGRCIQQIQH